MRIALDAQPGLEVLYCTEIADCHKYYALVTIIIKMFEQWKTTIKVSVLKRIPVSSLKQDICCRRLEIGRQLLSPVLLPHSNSTSFSICFYKPF